MTPERKRLASNAVGFLSGALACMDALRDVKAAWPPNAIWEGLRNVQLF
jgi:hypothetical protein